MEACTNSGDLFSALEVFDSDNDGKLSFEEFQFFMESFAKEYNNMRGNKIVEQMVNEVKKNACEDNKFEIAKIVRVITNIWGWIKILNLLNLNN